MQLTVQRMLRNRVLLKRHQPEEKIGSGILWAPDTRIDKNIRCTVLEVGPGVKNENGYTSTALNKGDVVIVRQFDGDPVGDSLDNPDVVCVNHDVVEAIDVNGEIKPLGDRLLVKVEPVEEKLGSGLLWAPPTAGNQKTHDRAVVLAIGPGKILPNGVQLPMSVKVGDTVILPKFRGTSIDSKRFGKTFLVSEMEILLVDLSVEKVHASRSMVNASYKNSKNEDVTIHVHDYLVTESSGRVIAVTTEQFEKGYISTGCCNEYARVPVDAS